MVVHKALVSTNYEKDPVGDVLEIRFALGAVAPTYETHIIVLPGMNDRQVLTLSICSCPLSYTLIRARIM